jgi:hypothetical protein
MSPAGSATPITAANRGSKSCSVILPTSRSNSSCRASGLERKWCATRSGSRPSAWQNAVNEEKTSVVSTPP